MSDHNLMPIQFAHGAPGMFYVYFRNFRKKKDWICSLLGMIIIENLVSPIELHILQTTAFKMHILSNSNSHGKQICQLKLEVNFAWVIKKKHI